MLKFGKNVRFYIKKRDAKLRELQDIQPFIAGSSMVKIAHVCGNSNCKCTKGKLHEQYYLTYKVKGKTHTRYIPIELEEEVRNWTLEYKRMKKLINTMTWLQRKLLKQYKVEKKAHKKAGKGIEELLGTLTKRKSNKRDIT